MKRFNYIEWVLVNQGECPSVDSVVDVNPECSQICPMDYSPVCGQDKDGNKQTFSNQCGFNYEKCSFSKLGTIDFI